VRSGRLQLGAGDLVVVDEAGQLETCGRWDRLLVAAGDAKLVAIGDPAQFPSIEAGGLLPVLEREVGASHLTRVYRAREDWLRDAWGAIRAGRGREALEEFDRRGLLHIAPRRGETREAMVTAWDRDRTGRPISQFLMVTDTSNREVDRLNAMAQQCRLDAGEITGEPVEVRFADPDDPEYVRRERLYAGDRVMLKRHISLGPGHEPLKNGQTASVAGTAGEVVVLDVDGRLVHLVPGDQDALRLNYAQHAYGAQGRTVDRVYGLMGGWSTDRESGYVSASRCREQAELFADADTLAVETTRILPAEGGLQERVPEEEWHAAARDLLAARYEESRPKVAALELLGRERAAEPGSASAQDAPGRSNAHALASPRQREYLSALGGELREGASWVEASLAIDRLRGEPEGEHAARLLLADRVPGDQVADALDLAAHREAAIQAVPASIDEPIAEPATRAPEVSVEREVLLEAERPGHLDRG
ncbi:MAG: ATP-dependent DNA helicase, partial [Candidatus Dormibacteria bacterium]